MSHVVALCERAGNRWRYKLMLRLDGREQLYPYHKFWHAWMSYEQCLAAVTRLKLVGEIADVEGLDDG